MTIDWTHFTPWSSLAGGLLIGLATALLLLLSGRIAGISGIVGGLLRPGKGDVAWRVAFVLGLFAAPLVFAMAAPLPRVTIDAGTATLIAAGLLVGGGNALRLGLHQWPRCIGFVARFAPLDRCYPIVHGRRILDGVPGPAFFHSGLRS